MFFSKLIDFRKKESILAFLRNHRRYNTMNSWNRATSFAHCVKIHTLGIPHELTDTAYNLLSTDDIEPHSSIESRIADFTREMNGEYTISFNGRSSGYLVLYRSRYETTGHKSYCTCCGQRNFKRVMPLLDDPNEKAVLAELVRTGSTFIDSTYLTQEAIQKLEISDDAKLELVRKLKSAAKEMTLDNQCGKCNQHTRVNYLNSPVSLSVLPGQPIGCDLDEMNMSQLKELAKTVQSFDKACDDIRDIFIEYCKEYEVVDEVIHMPKTIRVLKQRTENVPA